MTDETKTEHLIYAGLRKLSDCGKIVHAFKETADDTSFTYYGKARAARAGLSYAKRVAFDVWLLNAIR